jgi:peptide maturation system protein (TIGR04066 family)
MDKSAIIYPVTYKQLPIVALNKKYYPERNLIPLLSKAYCNIDSDISILDNRDNLGISSHSDLSRHLDDARNVLITPGTGSLDSLKLSLAGIKIATAAGKNVIGLFSETETKMLSSMAEGIFTGISKPVSRIMDAFKQQSYEPLLYEPSIPIIGVGSVFGYAHQSEITAQIALELKCRGYNATAITNSKGFCCLNFFPMPDALYDNSLPIVEKTLMINHYIRYVIESSNCELLVMEIPGGLARYNQRILNDLGQYAFIISEAISVDWFLCCTTCNDLHYELYSHLAQHFSNKFDLDVFCWHVSNSFIDLEALTHEQGERMIFKPQKQVYNTICRLQSEAKSPDIKFYNLQNQSQLQIIIDLLLNQLVA